MFQFLVVFVELIEGYYVIQCVDLIYEKIGGRNDQKLAEIGCRKDRQSCRGNSVSYDKRYIPRQRIEHGLVGGG